MNSYSILPFLLTAAPKVVFAIACIFVATVRRARHPRASLLLSLGLGALVTNAIGTVFAQNWMIEQTTAGNIEQVAAKYGFMTTGISFLQGVGLVLIVLAVFSDRNPAPAGPAHSGVSNSDSGAK